MKFLVWEQCYIYCLIFHTDKDTNSNRFFKNWRVSFRETSCWTVKPDRARVLWLTEPDKIYCTSVQKNTHITKFCTCFWQNSWTKPWADSLRGPKILTNFYKVSPRKIRGKKWIHNISIIWKYGNGSPLNMSWPSPYPNYRKIHCSSL